MNRKQRFQQKRDAKFQHSWLHEQLQLMPINWDPASLEIKCKLVPKNPFQGKWTQRCRIIGFTIRRQLARGIYLVVWWLKKEV